MGRVVVLFGLSLSTQKACQESTTLRTSSHDGTRSWSHRIPCWTFCHHLVLSQWSLKRMLHDVRHRMS
ncbi:hypothetical protein NC652_040279 [Populus alba x Populus x berolinensis]|nr:hypothetical protein NC651_039227 [Populus alba x Populus x berolinensis]KAJ6863679.1 hypothetical protein NC652_040279 [Populus alba x Populus x berolinensis]